MKVKVVQIDLDELIEVFVSLVVLIVGLGVILEIKGIESSQVINSIIEFLIPVFLGVFLVAAVYNAINEV